MLPWWSWVLVWMGVGLISVAILGWALLRCWRSLQSLTAVADELSALMVKLEARAKELHEASLALRDQPAYTKAITRGVPAIAREREALRERIDAAKDARHAARLARGRRLVTADPMQFFHLVRK